MNIEFYGVRGSYPTPGENTYRYGGNTTCVSISKEVDGNIRRIIIDCGTGAVQLGRDMISNYLAAKEDIRNVTMVFTHLHPDHTDAFPFFGPNYFTECSLNILGMKTLKKHVGSILEQRMVPPTFPIEYKDLKSNRNHYTLKDGDRFYILNDGSITRNPTGTMIFEIEALQAYAPSHPQQGALYYKVTDCDTGKSVACIWDLESYLGGDQRVIKFSKACDIMIHDTQYTDEEYRSSEFVVQGFGHSTYEMAIENARQADIKSALICTHYNPVHSDSFLDGIHEKYNELILPFDITMAKEGMKLAV